MPRKRRGRVPLKEREERNIQIIAFIMIIVFAALLLAYILDALGA